MWLEGQMKEPDTQMLSTLSTPHSREIRALKSRNQEHFPGRDTVVGKQTAQALPS